VRKKNLWYYKCNRIGCRRNKSAKYIHETFTDLLNNYTVSSDYIEPIKYQLDATFDELIESNSRNEEQIERSLLEIEKKLERLEERCVYEEIDKAMYEKFAVKLKQEKQQILFQFEKATTNLSNRKEYAEITLKLASNLQKMWKEGSCKVKEQLQYMLFPEGIIFDKQNQQYRTGRVNCAFELISYLSSKLEQKERGTSEPISENSPWVAPTRIELSLISLLTC
jgi:site-specific DNA recombinase